MNLMVRFIISCAVLALLQCMNIAGGGSEGEAKIVGRVVTETGSPAAGAVVWAIPYDYNPVADAPIPDSLKDTTDRNGRYTIRSVAKGRYNIQVVYSWQQTRSLITGICVTNNDSVIVPVDTVHCPGSVMVFLPAGIDAVKGYLYVPGTTLFVLLNGNIGYVLFDCVPSGILPSIMYGETASPVRHVIRYNVQVSPGNTTVIFMPDWKYAKRLYLNTTPTGANVAGTVTNFPVLVRLSSGNFDFSQAKSDGGDLRFTKANGVLLNYEIEDWSSAARTAAVWVQVDTVHGNNGTQSITMLWGNDTASSASNGKAVFDTAAGFAAVWHLNRSCADATPNHFDGTNYGTTDTTGLIGGAKAFNGNDSIKIAGLLNNPVNVTLSTWVAVDSALLDGGVIVSLGDHIMLRVDDHAEGGLIGQYTLDSISNIKHVCASTYYLAGSGWRYAVFVFNQAARNLKLYIDGSEVYTITAGVTVCYSRFGSNTLLGKSGNGSEAWNLIGSLDETRVCAVARSADWIKLCFMNQKKVDALIQ